MQEEGIRIARPLPYEFVVMDTVIVNSATTTASPDGGGGIGTEATGESSAMVATVSIAVINSGAGGAPFVLYDLLQLELVNPRQYAVEAGKSINDTQTISVFDPVSNTGTDGSYSYTLMGPNGFVREFRGDVRNHAASSDGGAEDDASCASVSFYLSYQPVEKTVTVHLANVDEIKPVTLSVKDNAYGLFDEYAVTLDARSTKDIIVSTLDSSNWYDLTVSVVANEVTIAPESHVAAAAPSVYSANCFYRRAMGHMEDSANSVSDPAMSKGISGLDTSRRAAGSLHDYDTAPPHPAIPQRLRNLKRLATAWTDLEQAFVEGGVNSDNKPGAAMNKDGLTFSRAEEEL